MRRATTNGSFGGAGFWPTAPRERSLLFPNSLFPSTTRIELKRTLLNRLTARIAKGPCKNNFGFRLIFRGSVDTRPRPARSTLYALTLHALRPATNHKVRNTPDVRKLFLRERQVP